MKTFLKAILLVSLIGSPALADSWRSLGALNNLEHASFGLINESCQYRVVTTLSRLGSDLASAGPGVPGAIYFDSVVRKLVSSNFGYSLLYRSADYDFVNGLKTAGAFTNLKDGVLAQTIMKSPTNKILSARFVVTESFELESVFNTTTTAAPSVEILYLPGKVGVRKIFRLSPINFELQTTCPASS